MKTTKKTTKQNVKTATPVTPAIKELVHEKLTNLVTDKPVTPVTPVTLNIDPAIMAKLDPSILASIDPTVLASIVSSIQANAKKTDSRTPEQRSEAAKKAAQTKTPEQRSEAAKKAWITNRAKKAQAIADTVILEIAKLKKVA